jgi:hypothetical protein
VAAIPLALNDVLAIKVFCYLTNQVSINTFNYTVTTLATAGVTYDNVATFFDTLMAPLFKPLICNVATYNVTHAQRLFPLPVSVYSESSASAGVGTGGPIALPSQCAGIISSKTLIAGQRYRGRKYIPFPSTVAASATGVPIAGYITNLDALATVAESAQNVVSGASTAVLTPILLHHFPAGSFTPIWQFNPSPKWGTMKKRGNYGQPNPLPT